MIRGYRGPVTKTERESELLSVTLQLLQERGYEGLTVDEVARRVAAGVPTNWNWREMVAAGTGAPCRESEFWQDSNA